MKKYIFFSFILLYGCGDVAKVEMQNANPVGIIEGYVRDGNTGMPLAGVSVKTIVNGQWMIKTTNSNGTYILQGLPVGGIYSVYFSISNYAPMFFDNISIQNNSKFPQGNARVELNVNMYPDNGSVKGVLYVNGMTASNSSIILDLRDKGYDLVLTAPTDANGAFSISQIPSSLEGLSFNANVLFVRSATETPVSGLFQITCFTGATHDEGIINAGTVKETQPEIINYIQYYESGGCSPYNDSANNSGCINDKTIDICFLYDQTMNISIKPKFDQINTDLHSVDDIGWQFDTVFCFSLVIKDDTDGRGNYRIKDARGVNGLKQKDYNSYLN